MDLFQIEKKNISKKTEPLAARMRPGSLKEVVGQSHILGPGKLLTRAIESDKISSIILYGPPGTGKTTLASVISNETKSFFELLNAVTSNVAQMRQMIDAAKKRFEISGQRTILFIDEIHRFNKAQQDILMPDVEKGNPILIGATTHNPFFSIVPALLSRSLVFELKPLSENELKIILKHALVDKINGFGHISIKIDEEALNFLAKISDGDARRALNALELGILTTQPSDSQIHLTKSIAEESIQKKAVVYDANEDQHYDTISAFIKSMRGSDPDAALYYLAKMLYAGEDTRFIARRMVIFASEDIGNADPMALVLANATLQATEFVGMPEARIIFSQAVIYLSRAAKSKEAYLKIEESLQKISSDRTQPIPEPLKNKIASSPRSSQ